VRLVAATNRNLEEAVTAGEFRPDLYFRISVVPILLAPLRERREDIPLLAREFLRRYNEAHGTSLSFEEDALRLLCRCEFPGNIRELESCVRRTAAFAAGDSIVADDFACQNDRCLSSLLWKTKPDPVVSRDWIPLPIHRDGLPGNAAARSPFVAVSFPDRPSGSMPAEGEPDSSDLLRGSSSEASPERERLIEAMERAGWVQAKAARLLGLSSRQMGYALRKHGIEIKRF
jgi:Nif-specific regulatory protein